jgi:hypothetical protein
MVFSDSVYLFHLNRMYWILYCAHPSLRFVSVCYDTIFTVELPCNESVKRPKTKNQNGSEGQANSNSQLSN